MSAADIAETLTNIPEFFENMNTFLPYDDEAGKQIGNYKLFQKIGEGGVDNVYLAEQKQPVRRQVAVAAKQIFKICLMVPPDPAVLQQLEPLAELLKTSMTESPTGVDVYRYA